MLAKNKVISKQYGKNNNRLKRGQINIRQVLFLENDVYIQIDVLQKSKKYNCTVLKSKLSTPGIICDEVYKIMMSICTKY